MKSIILTGFMGTGKTTVARILARRLGMRPVDLDRMIEERQGKTVTEIFGSLGEPAFRDMETEAVREVSGAEGLVVATGGGAVVREENRKAMRSGAIVINLVATAEEIERRLARSNDRPLLSQDRSTRIRTLLAEREGYYQDADVRIDTLSKNVEDVAAEIIDYLRGREECKN